MMNGIRIGSEFDAIRLKYCRDDNTYDEISFVRKAMACPIEWKPIRYTESMNFDEFVNSLFG